MMSLPRHMDDVLSVPQHLPESKDQSRVTEREKSLSPVSPPDNLPEQQKKPRILMIREEWVDLTGNPLTASLLGQMVQECQRVADFDLYVEEERTPLPKSFSSLQYGWFYKSSQELREETMLRVTLATFRRYMNFLKCRGWIQTRRNPQNKLDPKVQYRVSLRKLYHDLQKKGHTLPSFEAYGIFPHIPKDICTKSKVEKMHSAAQDKPNSKGRFL